MGVEEDGVEDVEEDNSTGNHEKNKSSMNDNDVIVTAARKLFKFGKAKNVPRGAPGGLSTLYGTLASASDQYAPDGAAEKSAKKLIDEGSARREVREGMANKEKPIVTELFRLGYMQETDKLSKKVLKVTSDRDLSKEMKLKPSAGRSVPSDDLLSMLQGRIEEQLLASAAARSRAINCAGNGIVSGNLCSQHTDAGAEREEIVFTPL